MLHKTNACRLSKMLATREVEQGHESLLRVVSRSLKFSDEGLLSHKQTLIRAR